MIARNKGGLDILGQSASNSGAPHGVTMPSNRADSRTPERGIYAASTSKLFSTAKRHECRAPFGFLNPPWSNRRGAKNSRALRPAAVKIEGMSAPYDQLLDATIAYLDRLKADGITFLPVGQADRMVPEASPLSRAAAERAPFVPSLSAGGGQATEPQGDQARPLGQDVAETFNVQRSTFNAQGSAAEEGPATQLVALKGQSTPTKAQALAALRERAAVCAKCPNLAASRSNVVFGVGDINSPLMFVGEAPGADEDRQGEPFVGVAGQLLTRIILAMGLTREKVYIANVLKCRPDTPGQRSGNRKPTPEEMRTCLPYLQQQIDLIMPKVIVALGGTALEGLLGEPAFITRLRGQWQTYRDIPLMPTFHPSYLLRPENAGQKRSVWEDMMLVMEKLEMPISEKQRGFFLKA